MQLPLHSSLSFVAGNSSVTSDYGSDTANEPSELGTSSVGQDDNFEVGIDDLRLHEDMTSSIEKVVKDRISNIDQGLFMGQSILEQLKGPPRHKANEHDNNVVENKKNHGNSCNASLLASNSMELFSEPLHAKVIGHVHKLSNESSLRGSDVSNSGLPNSSFDVSLDLPRGALVSRQTDNTGHSELQCTGDSQVVRPHDQNNKLNRILLTMQRRLVTARTDMEDVLVRLNQEIAAKDFLATKIKDVELELETIKQKSKENLQQAILIERERFTQMKWDMEEIRRKTLEMEMKTKTKTGGNSYQNLTEESIVLQKDVLLQNLNATKEQQEILSKQYEELEAKSKADVKVLVKEVKSQRSSQTKLKEQLSESVKEKCESEKHLRHVREKREQAEIAWRKLVQKYRLLYNQLQELNVILPTENNAIMNSLSFTGPLNKLAISDGQIGLLPSEVQNLRKDYGRAASDVDKINDIEDGVIFDDELRKILTDLFIDNIRLRKQISLVGETCNETGHTCK